MRAVIFDTETTGLIENRSLRLSRQPHVIEFYGCEADLDDGGRIIREVEHLIRPAVDEKAIRTMLDRELTTSKKKTIIDDDTVASPMRVSKTISTLTGIKWQDLETKPSFGEVADQILELLSCAEIVVAHNLSFDADVIEIEAERIGRTVAWPRKVCTVESTVHVKGKYLSLTDLHEHLFGMKFPEAHRARSDALALLRVATELRRRDWL